VAEVHGRVSLTRSIEVPYASGIEKERETVGRREFREERTEMTQVQQERTGVSSLDPDRREIDLSVPEEERLAIYDDFSLINTKRTHGLGI
jgi:hypothetical protein